MSGAQEQPTATAIEDKQPDAAESKAAFMAGFDDDDDGVQPTATPAAPAPSPAPTPSPTPAPEPEYVQVTKTDWEKVSQSAAKVDEIAATLSNRFDQAFGKMGGLERKLAEITTSTPKGDAVHVGEEDFAELKAEYPQLRELTVKGLNGVLAKLKGTGGAAVDAETIQKMVSEHMGKVFNPVDMQLNSIVPKWREKVKAPEFGEWLKGQSPEVQRLADSASQDDAAELLLAWRDRSRTAAPKPPAAPPPAPAAPAQPSMRSRQIAAAVTPKGDSASPPSSSGKSPFQAGFDEDD